MNVAAEQRLVVLEEQCAKPEWLSLEDAALLIQLRFDVVCLASSDTTGEHPGQAQFLINPKQYVSHLALPSGTLLIVRPKIDPSQVFRLLAYVYAGWNKDVFRQVEVSYSSDNLLFEPLIELFNELIAARVRRGLVQDYVRHEDNLSVMRGRIQFERHIALNAMRPDRLFCRYHHQTVDNEDNQILKWTLRLLASVNGWSSRTVHSLRVNLRHFSEVSLRAPDRVGLGDRVYHRMNDDYRLLHDLCRLFLDGGAIDEHTGDWRFRGFLLDMNRLFEAFVSKAFEAVAGRLTNLTAHPQKAELLCQAKSGTVWIQPDVTICEGSRAIVIVDAKYKRPEGGPINPDLYQMIAYGTALQCNRAFLLYPATESALEETFEIRHSPITVHVRHIDIGHEECVPRAERVAEMILQEIASEMRALG